MCYTKFIFNTRSWKFLAHELNVITPPTHTHTWTHTHEHIHKEIDICGPQNEVAFKNRVFEKKVFKDRGSYFKLCVSGSSRNMILSSHLEPIFSHGKDIFAMKDCPIERDLWIAIENILQCSIINYSTLVSNMLNFSFCLLLSFN